MSWEGAPPRRRLNPSAIAVVGLVAVGVALALATTLGGALDDRVAIDSDADEPAGDEDVFDSERALEDVDPVESSSHEEEPQEGGQSDDDVDRVEPTETLPGDPDLQVFLHTRQGELGRIDLDTGHMTVARSRSRHPSVLLIVGDSLLYDKDGMVAAIDADLEGEAELLVEGHEAYPANEGEAWVVQYGRTGQALKVAVSSGETIASHDLMSSQVLGAHGDELVVEQHGHLSVQDLETGEGRSIGSGNAMSYRDGRVAWMDCGSDLSCDLVTSDVEDGSERRVPVPSLARPILHNAALSPNGEIVLSPMLPEAGEPTLAAISTIDGTITEIESLSGHAGRIEWAPDSSWAFIDAPGKNLIAWRAADGETAMLHHGFDDDLTGIAVR